MWNYIHFQASRECISMHNDELWESCAKIATVPKPLQPCWSRQINDFILVWPSHSRSLRKVWTWHKDLCYCYSTERDSNEAVSPWHFREIMIRFMVIIDWYAHTVAKWAGAPSMEESEMKEMIRECARVRAIATSSLLSQRVKLT